MPKPKRFPVLLNELKTISITLLKKQGYLNPNQWQSGLIRWSIDGEPAGSISIGVCTLQGSGFAELKYTVNGKKINYRINLVCTPSNLGKGVVWNFLCPLTKKHCRKLYLADHYFLHRKAYPNAMYEKQTQSKDARKFVKLLVAFEQVAEAIEQTERKHFKWQYSGKPTKRYLKLVHQIEKANTKIAKEDN